MVLAERIAGGEVTAIFVGNDQIALGLILALHEAGLRVPEDVSIVGFDDIPEAGFFHPPLTTMRQNFAETERQRIELVLSRIADEPGEPGPVIHPGLVLRGSTPSPRG